MNSVYGDRLLTCRIAPFGHPRIKARLQLPEAFRSLPRPSSAPSAKAFTLCSCSLDHYAILWFSFSAIVVSLPNISISKTILLLSQLLSLFNFQCAGGHSPQTLPRPSPSVAEHLCRSFASGLTHLGFAASPLLIPRDPGSRLPRR